MVEKTMKKGLKKGLKLGKVSPQLTSTEKDILRSITIDYLTPKQVSIRRQCSVQAIYKIIKSLKEKGALTSTNEMVEKIRPTIQPKNQIRLHAQEFNIKILYKDTRYKQSIKKTNTINIDGNTIRLYKDSIEIYSSQSFFADDVQKATVRSFEYWNRFFRKLENNLKVILIKSKSQNIKLVNQHYAETNNEFAEDCTTNGDKIRIYTRDDGKLWFLIDNSFNLHEAETVHPETAQKDMGDVIRPFFNDLRDNKPPTMSEMMGILKMSIEINKETAAGLNTLIQLRKPQETELNQEIEGIPSYIG